MRKNKNRIRRIGSKKWILISKCNWSCTCVGIFSSIFEIRLVVWKKKNYWRMKAIFKAKIRNKIKWSENPISRCGVVVFFFFSFLQRIWSRLNRLRIFYNQNDSSTYVYNTACWKNAIKRIINESIKMV